MKILLFTQFCTPEPIFKSLPFAAELRRRGHEVRILTGYPNYPGGKVYPGYRLGLWLREEMEGIPLLRVPLFPSHGASTVGRLANYCSFTAAAVLPTVRAASATTSPASVASTTTSRNRTDLSVDESAGGKPPAFFFESGITVLCFRHRRRWA